MGVLVWQISSHELGIYLFTCRSRIYEWFFCFIWLFIYVVYLSHHKREYYPSLLSSFSFNLTYEENPLIFYSLSTTWIWILPFFIYILSTWTWKGLTHFWVFFIWHKPRNFIQDSFIFLFYVYKFTSQVMEMNFCFFYFSLRRYAHILVVAIDTHSKIAPNSFVSAIGYIITLCSQLEGIESSLDATSGVEFH